MESRGLIPPGIRVAAAFLLAAAAGCGSRDQGWVSGRVLYKGQPVTGGLVTFLPADNAHRPVSAPIDENGRYQTYVPIGEVKIAIDNRELQPPPPNPGGGFAPPGIKVPPAEKQGGDVKENPSAPKRPPGVYVAIPEEYYDVGTSGLHYAVQAGSQTHDIELPEITRRKR